MPPFRDDEINHRDERLRPQDWAVFQAIRAGDMNALHQALQSGGDPDASLPLSRLDDDEERWEDVTTPLLEALRHPSTDMATSLVDVLLRTARAPGALLARLQSSDPVYEAIAQHRWDVAHHLLDQGLRAGNTDRERFELLDLSMVAVNVTMVERLLGLPGFTHQAPFNGTLLHQAVTRMPGDDAMHTPAHDALLDRVLRHDRASLHHRVQDRDPLLLAVERCSSRTVQRLIDAGADLHRGHRLAIEDPVSPLRAQAGLAGLPPVVHWADHGYTALHSAALCNRPSTCALLLAAGADPEARTDHPITYPEAVRAHAPGRAIPPAFDAGPGLTPLEVAHRNRSHAAAAVLEAWMLRQALPQEALDGSLDKPAGRPRL